MCIGSLPLYFGLTCYTKIDTNTFGLLAEISDWVKCLMNSDDKLFCLLNC